jgi:hypothetical protein
MTTTPANHDSHPNLADLDALRTGEAGPEVRRHVDGCERCAALLGELEADATIWAAALAPEAAHVPEETEQRVIEAVYAEATRIRRTARRGGRLLRIACAAAAVLLLGAGLSLFGERESLAPDRSAVSRLDVDASGRVDIVDAYLVARRLRRGEEAPGRWDVNDDGTVDSGDVRTIARAAVTLDGSER